VFFTGSGDIVFVPLHPDETKNFLVEYFGFPSDIKVLERKEEGTFSSLVNLSDNICLSIFWGFFSLCFVFEGFPEKEKRLQKAKAFFSEQQIFPTQKNGKVIFEIEKNLFLESISIAV